jgi:hypothetical protein
MYEIAASDFDSKSVTNRATALFRSRELPITSSEVSTTVACQYRSGWVVHTVEPTKNLQSILDWYPHITQVDLKRANCMASLEKVQTGQTIYVPSPPPLASISVWLHDTAGQALDNTPVTMTGIRNLRSSRRGDDKRFKENPLVMSSATNLAKNAEDKKNQQIFELQLGKALKEDPAFTDMLSKLLKEAQTASRIPAITLLLPHRMKASSSENIVIGNRNQIECFAIRAHKNESKGSFLFLVGFSLSPKPAQDLE